MVKVKTQEIKNIFEEGILVNLKIRCWGATKRVTDEVFKDDLNKENLRAVQDLIEDRTILDKIISIRNTAKSYLKMWSINFGIDGMAFISNKNVDMFERFFEESKEEFLNLVDDFLSEYELLKSKFAASNPNLYQESNYPTVAQLREQFKFEWFYREIKVAESLPEQLKKREVEKFKNEIQDMKDNVKNIIANEVYNRIKTLSDQCAENKINNATLQGINNFLDRFDKVFSGFFDQKKLDQLVAEIKVFLGGVEAGDLKADEEFKQAVEDQMKNVLSELENIKDVKLSRALEI